MLLKGINKKEINKKETDLEIIYIFKKVNFLNFIALNLLIFIVSITILSKTSSFLIEKLNMIKDNYDHYL